MDGRMILAIDPATVTGWCAGRIGGNGRPESGTVRFGNPGQSHETIFGVADEWIEDLIEDYRPDIFLFEPPLPSWKMKKATDKTVRLLHGLAGILQARAYRAGIPEIREAQVQDVCGFMLGQRGVKSAEKKKHTKLMVKAMGFAPGDDNEADAIAIWHYGCRCYAPGSVKVPYKEFPHLMPEGAIARAVFK